MSYQWRNALIQLVRNIFFERNFKTMSKKQIKVAIKQQMGSLSMIVGKTDRYFARKYGPGLAEKQKIADLIFVNWFYLIKSTRRMLYQRSGIHDNALRVQHRFW